MWATKLEHLAFDYLRSKEALLPKPLVFEESDLNWMS